MTRIVSRRVWHQPTSTFVQLLCQKPTMRQLHLLVSTFHFLLWSLHHADAWSPSSSAPHRTMHSRRSVFAAAAASSAAVLLLPQQPAQAVEAAADPWATIQPPPPPNWPDAASHPLPGGAGGGDLQQAIQESERKKQIGPTTHG